MSINPTGIRKPRFMNFFIASVCMVILQACGGGGSGSASTPADTPPPPPPPAESASTVTSSGVITGFGSVFVNGVEYETDSAEIESDDEVASEADLKVGQIVTITGNKNDDGITGSADSIKYNDDVEGPITSINGNVIVVLGQNIIVVPGTVFDDSINPQSPDGLNVGDVIEVSGFLNADGDIQASYIESKSSGGEFELVGIVRNLDSNSSTFDIGNQSVDYSNAELDDFDGAVLAEGDRIEVKGSTFGTNGELIATKVELEDDDFSESDEVEVEGLVSRFESATDFDISGISITTTSNTTYEGGTAVNLSLNVKVEAEGTIDASGNLVARKIQFKNQENTRFEAVVDSADEASNSVVVLGITINVTLNTQLEDDSDLEVMFFGVKDIAAGDFLEIRGQLEQDGTVTATRLERDDLDDDTFVRGQVQSNDGVTLVIAGVTIRTNPSTQYRDSSDMGMTEADFFAAAQVGVEVKAKGLETDTSEITAEELELEDDD